MTPEEEGAYYGLTEDEVREAIEQFGAQAEAALDLAEEKGVENLTIPELLAASSLGSAIGLWMSAQITPEDRARLHRMLDEMNWDDDGEPVDVLD